MAQSSIPVFLPLTLGNRMKETTKYENQSNDDVSTSKKDISFWFIILLFVIYATVFILVLGVYLPHIMMLDLPFRSILFVRYITFAFAIFIFSSPLILLIYIVKKLRKRSYQKPILHLAITSIVIFFLALLGQIGPMFPFIIRAILGTTS